MTNEPVKGNCEFITFKGYSDPPPPLSSTYWTLAAANKFDPSAVGTFYKASFIANYMIEGPKLVPPLSN